MARIGFSVLLIACIAIVASIIVLTIRVVARNRLAQKNAHRLSVLGRLAIAVSFASLLVACLLITYCFVTHDVSLLYVLKQRTLSTDSDAWLYTLSGLWAGQSGSLLFWAFLISVFNFSIAIRKSRTDDALDLVALLMAQIILAAFVAIIMFSPGSMPFTATPDYLFTDQGELVAEAQLYGMNQLLEHWAMSIHPPTLFIGYAGLTIPFAYAVGALVLNDSSSLWVTRARRYAIFSWLFLTAGIGLGSVWAYVVLGWGGYWGWDPVENASLFSWFVGLAFIHSSTVYRQRGAFKRWAIVCACLTFLLVILAAFITRSGIVQSVHAFAGDLVSLISFGLLLIVPIVVSVIGLISRWRSFGPDIEGRDDVENMFSKDAAYYFNNVILLVFTALLVYMTLSESLPSWMPFGGESIAISTYEAIARPMGIIYLLILALCPLLSWGSTNKELFVKQMRVPAICAIVMFAVLLGYYVTNLLPAYNTMIAQGGTKAQTLLEAGPKAYYQAVAIVGLAVASLLFFTSLFMIIRGVKNYSNAQHTSLISSIGNLCTHHASMCGGAISHFAMAIILVGLIGSSMFVTEKVDYLPYDPETNTVSETFTIKDYEIVFKDQSVSADESGRTAFYEVDFDVYKEGTFIETVHPQVQLDVLTQQQKQNAAVLHFADEDLFVVYRGVSPGTNDFSLDVRVNPLINFVWGGFGLLLVGILLALVGKIQTRRGNVRDELKPVQES